MPTTAEAIILIKAAPIVGDKHGETVCCAGIDIYGHWLRMYPVSFRTLEDKQKFSRWDKVRFEYRLPTHDTRIESRHVKHQTLEITGRVKTSERAVLLEKLGVTSLDAEFDAGRSLALLNPKIIKFLVVKKNATELVEEQVRIDQFHSQTDMFLLKPSIPRKACPYSFKYRYSTSDGDREGTCQDWETEATYYLWSKKYGESDALERMIKRFGSELPKRGLYFAMGTHSRWPKQWLINGLIQYAPPEQASLF